MVIIKPQRNQQEDQLAQKNILLQQRGGKG